MSVSFTGLQMHIILCLLRRWHTFKTNDRHMLTICCSCLRTFFGKGEAVAHSISISGKGLHLSDAPSTSGVRWCHRSTDRSLHCEAHKAFGVRCPSLQLQFCTRLKEPCVQQCSEDSQDGIRKHCCRTAWRSVLILCVRWFHFCWDCNADFSFQVIGVHRHVWIR